MWDNILDQLTALNMRGELPDLSIIPGFSHKQDTTELNE
jgi:hypothetical protein